MAVRMGSEFCFFFPFSLCMHHMDGIQRDLSDVAPPSAARDRSPKDITDRLDRLIADIRKRFHGPAMEANANKSPSAPRDVLVVAHGHILRAFAARWVGRDVSVNPSFLLEAGGVGTLSYEHNKIDEPAVLLGGAFVTDVIDEVEAEATEKAEKKEGK